MKLWKQKQELIKIINSNITKKLEEIWSYNKYNSLEERHDAYGNEQIKLNKDYMNCSLMELEEMVLKDI
jgi:hypothetical protein